MVTFTDKGAEKVSEFLVAQDADAALAGLRVGVRGGGCSSFTCIATSLGRALNALDGEPVAFEALSPV